MVDEQHSAGGADDTLLPDDVLVTGHVHVAHPAEVRARRRPGSAGVGSNRLGEVHHLHVEGVGPLVDDRVSMQRLRFTLMRPAHMDVLMVSRRSRTDQALDRPAVAGRPSTAPSGDRAAWTSVRSVPFGNGDSPASSWAIPRRFRSGGTTPSSRTIPVGANRAMSTDVMRSPRSTNRMADDGTAADGAAGKLPAPPITI